MNLILLKTGNAALNCKGGIYYMSKVKLGPQTLVYPQPVFLIGADVDEKPNFLAVS